MANTWPQLAARSGANLAPPTWGSLGRPGGPRGYLGLPRAPRGAQGAPGNPTEPEGRRALRIMSVESSTLWESVEPLPYVMAPAFEKSTLFKRPVADAAAQRFSGCFEKFGVFENWSKSDPGSILGRFGLEIRNLREKLYRDVSSNQYFVIF